MEQGGGKGIEGRPGATIKKKGIDHGGVKEEQVPRDAR